MRAPRTCKLLLSLLLGACASDEPEGRRIGLGDVVHEYWTGGTAKTQVALSRLDGSGMEQLTQLGENAFFPAVSPDGRWIVFVQLSQLWLLEVGTGQVTQLTNGPAGYSSPRWSPDGTRLLYAFFQYVPPYNADVCIRTLAGTDSSCLTSTPDADDDAADWSPDGRRIVWARRVNTFGDLWIMDADGGSQRLLLDHSDYDGGPQWSPDGRSILFSSWRYGPPSQFILDVGTGAIRPVLGDSLDPAFMETAAWTPDGRGVVIEVVNPNDRLALVDLATGDARFLSGDTLASSSFPSMRRSD